MHVASQFLSQKYRAVNDITNFYTYKQPQGLLGPVKTATCTTIRTREPLEQHSEPLEQQSEKDRP